MKIKSSIAAFLFFFAFQIHPRPVHAQTDSIPPMYRLSTGITGFFKPWENFSEILGTGDFTYVVDPLYKDPYFSVQLLFGTTIQQIDWGKFAFQLGILTTPIVPAAIQTGGQQTPFDPQALAQYAALSSLQFVTGNERCRLLMKANPSWNGQIGIGGMAEGSCRIAGNKTTLTVLKFAIRITIDGVSETSSGIFEIRAIPVLLLRHGESGHNKRTTRIRIMPYAAVRIISGLPDPYNTGFIFGISAPIRTGSEDWSNEVTLE